VEGKRRSRGVDRPGRPLISGLQVAKTNHCQASKLYPSDLKPPAGVASPTRGHLPPQTASGSRTALPWADRTLLWTIDGPVSLWTF
jgi:hypothetical protein